MTPRSTILSAGLTLLVTAFYAGAHAQAAKSYPGPDMHGTPPHPLTLPNHQPTEVTKDGMHFTGGTVTVKGVCTLQSYKILSDTLLSATITGNRTVEGEEDTCFIYVHHGPIQAHIYMIVDLTPEEEAQRKAIKNAHDQAKANAYMTNLGTQWTLHYADGATEVFTAQPAGPGQLPEFTSSSGTSVKIMLSNSNQVMILADSCMLSGTLAGSQVRDGKASGQCKHSGAWTAQKK